MLAAALLSSTLVLAVMACVMLAAWALQRRLGNPGWIDVFWTLGSGVTCAGAALWPLAGAEPARQALVTLLVGLWSLRLGLYIAFRVARSDEDARYTQLRAQWGAQFQPRLLRFVMLQAPATALLSLSVFAAAHGGGALGLRDLGGLTILAIAIAGEAVADEEMRRYKLQPDRPPVMDQGLWGRSRHPNYFFEWLGWLALPVIGFAPLEAASWLTLIAPAIMYLILRHGTGVPMLEASMLARKGDDFRRYQARVNAFFPAVLTRPRGDTPPIKTRIP